MKLNFRKSGSGEPLIILHGLFGLSDNWATLGKKYSEKFAVYLVDLRNHGASPRSDEWNYEVMSEDIAELIENENLGKANILGHSMGGKTAMFLAVRKPELLNKMIVADISPAKGRFTQNDVLEALNAVNFDVVKSRRDVEEVISLYVSENGVRQFLLKNLYWNDEDRLEWKFNLPVITKNLEEITAAVPQVKTEVESLFIRGEESGYIKKEDEELILSIFPNSKIETIADAGHWVHADQPAAFYEATIRFLE